MRVAVFLSFKNSLKTWIDSGTIERELKLFEELAIKYNYQFTFFTYGINEKDTLKNYSNNFKVFEMGNLIKLGPNNSLNFLRSLILPLKLFKELNEIDVIYQNQLRGSWIVLILKILSKKPLFIRTGYDLYKFSIHENKKKYKIIFFKILTKYSLKLSSIYTVTSETEKNFLISNFNFDENKIYKIPNWTYKNTLNNSRRDLFKLLSVGRLVDQKNYKELFKKLKNLPEKFELDIVGIGDEKEELEKLSKEYKLKVNFLGKLDNNSLQNIFEEYQFYLTAAKFEGNPKTVLEAMSKGCVVIASDITNHSEIIRNKFNGYLFSLNAETLVDKIEELIKNENEIHFIQNNAIDSVNENNELYIILEKYHNLFAKLENI